MTWVVIAVCTGCGVPDLAHMRPTAWKPAAEVVLVGTAAGWNADTVTRLAAQDGMVARVVPAAPASWQAVLGREVMRASGVLFLVVFPGPVPQDAWRFAAAHPASRFEFCGTNLPGGSPPANVRAMVPDAAAAGYWAGWLAGQLAAGRKTLSVGWYDALPSNRFASGNPVQTSFPRTAGVNRAWLRTAVRAALVGLYTSYPAVSLTEVTTASAGGTAASVPDVVVSVSPPPAWLATAMAQRQGVLVVLTGVTPVGVAGMSPRVPAPQDLSADLTAWAQRAWHPGVTTLGGPRALSVTALPATLTATWRIAAAGTALTPALVDRLWASLPDVVRAAWSVWVP
ncbi:hypothetical protein GCM10010885_12200 [Alicyclobacillus cellulosilyticus]|uniref:Uncharacterized protein n=1 Tax=Alicyclobacillus cellulosilyticus TaxID=1003997 RepID=A0A917KAN2_9BACL|nr:hypothetical protein [Alicyclobacillus cellulosilyticus]GGJ04567.1 hypothetical protein GCM10010885_12200 [Alicyclobacillus cellulosilyticus]